MELVRKVRGPKSKITVTQRVAGPKPCVTLRPAFTLTELLVVITIISILASFITVAAVNAMNAAKRSEISLEIKQMSSSIEEFKNQYSLYPPNAMNTYGSNYKGEDIADIVVNDFVRSFRKAFPRHNEPELLLRRLAGLTGGDTTAASELPGGMNAAEAIYFWLGGFSSDPLYPISGAGGPSFANASNPANVPTLADEVIENRNLLYEFDQTRLGPRTEDGYFDDSVGRSITYQVNVNGQLQRRRINLWTYAPKKLKSSFVYFDASRHDPIAYDVDLSGNINAGVFGVKKVREGFASGSLQPEDVHFVNKGKFQILQAGLDDAWGDDFSRFSLQTGLQAIPYFPPGPYTGEIADTLSNFADGTFESAQE